jgi:uncharacterized protein YegL
MIILYFLFSKEVLSAKSILLIMDCSGSMKGNKIEEAKNYSIEFINNLPQDIEISLMAYFDCGDIEILSDFTRNKDFIINKITNLSTKSGTPMFRAINLALDYINRNARYDSKVIILLSDGQDTCSGSLKDIELKVASIKGSIKIFTIGYDIKENSQAEKQLVNIANIGNGKYYPSENTTDLINSFKNIEREIIERKQEEKINILFSEKQKIIEYLKNLYIMPGKIKLKGNYGYDETAAINFLYVIENKQIVEKDIKNLNLLIAFEKMIGTPETEDGAYDSAIRIASALSSQISMIYIDFFRSYNNFKRNEEIIRNMPFGENLIRLIESSIIAGLEKSQIISDLIIKNLFKGVKNDLIKKSIEFIVGLFLKIVLLQVKYDYINFNEIIDFANSKGVDNLPEIMKSYGFIFDASETKLSESTLDFFISIPISSILQSTYINSTQKVLDIGTEKIKNEIYSKDFISLMNHFENKKRMLFNSQISTSEKIKTSRFFCGVSKNISDFIERIPIKFQFTKCINDIATIIYGGSWLYGSSAGISYIFFSINELHTSIDEEKPFDLPLFDLNLSNNKYEKENKNIFLFSLPLLEFFDQQEIRNNKTENNKSFEIFNAIRNFDKSMDKICDNLPNINENYINELEKKNKELDLVIENYLINYLNKINNIYSFNEFENILSEIEYIRSIEFSNLLFFITFAEYLANKSNEKKE